jgi:uncharacterized short protein YbdD (DUF466 family)
MKKNKENKKSNDFFSYTDYTAIRKDQGKPKKGIMTEEEFNRIMFDE